MLSYGQAMDTDVKPILKLELALSLPSIVVWPSLDEVQGIINDVVHAILGMFRGVYQWEQDRGLLKAAPESTVLLSPSKISALAGALGSSSKLLQSPSTLGILGSPSIINTLGSPSKINALGSLSKINALGSPSKINALHASIQRPKLKDFYRMVSENKDIGTLVRRSLLYQAL